MNRPKCRRCKGPLDIWYEPSDDLAVPGEYVWICNNPKTLETDEQFKKRWNNLSGDDVVKLLKQLKPEEAKEMENDS